jgi:hypothetical protein
MIKFFKKLSIIFIVLFFAVCAYADSALQIDFLLAGYRHPTSDAVLSGGKVYTYLDGTSTLSALWTDKDKGGAAANPVILDSSGKAEVFGDNIYKFLIYDSDDVLIETLNGLEYLGDSDSANFYPDYTAADQGTTGSNNTLKYYIDTIGADQATIVLRHNSGAATTTYTLTTAETIPENIKLKFEKGAILFLVGKLTVYSAFNIEAQASQTIFSLGVFPEFTKGGEVSVIWFGAKSDKTDAAGTTIAIQAAIDSSSDIYFPPGDYAIDTCIDGTTRGNAGGRVISLRGAPGYSTSEIYWEGAATGTMFDFTQSRFGRIKDLMLRSTVTTPMEVAMLFSRGTVGGDNSDDWYLEDVHIWAYCSIANIVSVTVEGFVTVNCTFANYLSSGYTFARVKSAAAVAALGVTSTYGTIVPFNGNTLGWSIGTHYYHYGTGTPMLLDGTEGFGIHGGFFYSAGANEYIECTGNTHNLDIQNVNFEASAIHLIHFSDAASYNQNINLNNIISISESTSLGGAAIFAATGAVIQGMTVKNILGYTEAGGVDWYLMSVDSLYGADIKTGVYAYEIRGANNGNSITTEPTGDAKTIYTGSLDITKNINSRNYYWSDDFDDEASTVQLESSLNADFWTTAGTNYAAANVTYTTGPNGELKALCAAADNDSVTIFGINQIKTDKNPIIEARIKIDTKETAAFYFGVVQGAFADVNTFNPNNAFLVGINSDNGHGFGATQIIAGSTDTGAAVVYDDMGVAIVSNTYVKIKIDLNDVTQPRVWIDDVEVAAASITGTIQTNVAVGVYLMVQNLAGGAIQRFITVDYIKVWSDR